MKVCFLKFGIVLFLSVGFFASAALVPYPATDALTAAMAPYRLAAGKYVSAEAMPAEDGVRLPNEVPFLLYTPEKPKTDGSFQQRTGIRFLRLLPEPRLPEPLAVREIAVKP